MHTRAYRAEILQKFSYQYQRKALLKFKVCLCAGVCMWGCAFWCGELFPLSWEKQSRHTAQPELSYCTGGGRNLYVHDLSEEPWDCHVDHFDFEQLVREIVATVREQEGDKEFTRLAWVVYVSHNPNWFPCSESCFF